MSWTYRIVRTRPSIYQGKTVRYAIHEAYYGNDTPCSPEEIYKASLASIEELDRTGVSWTESPIIVESFVDENEDDPKEQNRQREQLKLMLQRMLKACDYPIVDEDNPKTYNPEGLDGLTGMG